MEKTTENYTTPSDDDLAEAISDAYTACIGLGANKMAVATFAGAVGCCPSAAYQLKSGELRPGSTLLMKSAAVLGPQFINKIAARIGMGGLYRLDGDNIAVLDMASDLSQDASETLIAAADGVVDHKEAAVLATRYRASATKQNEMADQLDSVAQRGGSISVIASRQK